MFNLYYDFFLMKSHYSITRWHKCCYHCNYSIFFLSNLFVLCGMDMVKDGKSSSILFYGVKVQNMEETSFFMTPPRVNFVPLNPYFMGTYHSG